MNTYGNRMVSEATLQEADERKCGIGEALRESGHQSLAAMAKQPEVIKAVNHARTIISKDRWQELNRPSATLTEAERVAAWPVWDALPGYTCLMDAVAILARL